MWRVLKNGSVERIERLDGSEKVKSVNIPSYLGSEGSTEFKDREMVNHPDHYNQGTMEVIDIIEHACSHISDSYRGGLVFNVIKYLLRCEHKDDAKEDLNKAKWYLDKLIDTF